MTPRTMPVHAEVWSVGTGPLFADLGLRQLRPADKLTTCTPHLRSRTHFGGINDIRRLRVSHTCIDSRGQFNTEPPWAPSAKLHTPSMSFWKENILDMPIALHDARRCKGFRVMNTSKGREHLKKLHLRHEYTGVGIDRLMMPS